MKLIDYCEKTIRWSFYILLFFVPIILTSNTSELFELNKMWLTWGLTIIITGAWIIKMTVSRSFTTRRTPLDIPILLFLFSQLISTLFSLDTRVSLWGYYSRFNGGFLSILSYTLLYFAFVSNSSLQIAKRYLYATILGSVVVVLWGLPSHFGADPTCMLFRGTLDTSCWTESFRPTIRIFSTLGQPAWMAAYTATLLPIIIALFMWQRERFNTLPFFTALKKPLVGGLFLLSALTYLDLLYTDTRAGFLAFWGANAFFWLILFFIKLLPVRKLVNYFLLFNLVFIFFNFTSGTPISQLDRLSLRALQSTTPPAAVKSGTLPEANSIEKKSIPNKFDTGITDSSSIRLLVWRGAIDAWKAYPIFGTGVETFAYAYYLHRPAAHNLTSEWDYLYNKAHNEYLNYLTTTGIAGLGTYVLVLVGFFALASASIRKLRHKDSATPMLFENKIVIASLPPAMVSILISNFFGFSVVMMNLLLYFIPLWLFFFSGILDKEKLFGITLAGKEKKADRDINAYQWTTVIGIVFLCLFLLSQLIRFWNADVAYALGSNYNRAGDPQTAYQLLKNAVDVRPEEPIFQDEYALNLATLATAYIQNKDTKNGTQLAQQAITISNDVVTNHPNNLVFWKSRVRIFYLLAQANPAYYSQALDAILYAKKLAPSDAKISYNLGILYGQNAMLPEAISELSRTITLKPNYRDAYYARALFSKQLSEKQTGNEKAMTYSKGVNDLQFILKNLSLNDPDAKKTLESWGEKF